MKAICSLPRIASLAAIAAVGLSTSVLTADEHEHEKAPVGMVAVAVMQATAGNEEIKGEVHFIQEKEGVRVKGRIQGLTPGLHGFHIHQFGDLRSDDGTAAGGHFNPTGADHGGPDHDHKSRHVGDLGNIKANDDGVAEFDMVDKHLSLHGDHSILGRSVVVHADADDLKSQPSGNAGPRVGVGVIGVANPEKK